MKRIAITILASALLAAPAMAQWSSDYNMGSIGVLGGNSASGTISVTCAEAGNGVVDQGALSIFLKPGAASMIGSTSPGELTFDVDGTVVSLPVGDNAGDGFVYDKTAATLADATALIDLLKDGKSLTVKAGDEQLARLRLKGAADALDGVEACLAP